MWWRRIHFRRLCHCWPNDLYNLWHTDKQDCCKVSKHTKKTPCTHENRLANSLWITLNMLIFQSVLHNMGPHSGSLQNTDITTQDFVLLFKSLTSFYKIDYTDYTDTVQIHKPSKVCGFFVLVLVQHLFHLTTVSNDNTEIIVSILKRKS